MTHRIKRLMTLSLSDWQILFSASFLLPAVALSLKFFGLKQTQSIITQHTETLISISEPTHQKLQEAKNIARLVHICAKFGPYRANCLKQALVLWYYLKKKGIPSRLHIGIRRNQNQLLDAHAWLECAGQPLIDSKTNLQIFSSIYSNISLFF